MILGVRMDLDVLPVYCFQNTSVVWKLRWRCEMVVRVRGELSGWDWEDFLHAVLRGWDGEDFLRSVLRCWDVVDFHHAVLRGWDGVDFHRPVLRSWDEVDVLRAVQIG